MSEAVEQGSDALSEALSNSFSPDSIPNTNTTMTSQVESICLSCIDKIEETPDNKGFSIDNTVAQLDLLHQGMEKTPGTFAKEEISVVKDLMERLPQAAEQAGSLSELRQSLQTFITEIKNTDEIKPPIEDEIKYY